ncbi:MAG: hypothetical protein RL112_558, partial [Planctomycetota bacterium]
MFVWKRLTTGSYRDVKSMQILHLPALFLACCSPAWAMQEPSRATDARDARRPAASLAVAAGAGDQARVTAQAQGSRAMAPKARASRATSPKGSGKSGVLVGGKLHAFDDLPKSLGPQAQAAARRARSWCEQTGSVVLADAKDRFVLVASAEMSGKERHLAIATKTANWLDEELPPTPNQMPPLAEGQHQDDVFDPDGSAAILYMLDTEADQARLVQQLAAEEPSLADWRRDAAGLAGFHL